MDSLGRVGLESRWEMVGFGGPSRLDRNLGCGNWTAAGLSAGHHSSPMVAWHPDSRRLASANGGGDFTVRIWDLETEEAVLTVPGTPPLAWSPDGKQLAYRQEMGTKILNASQGYRHADTFEYRLELVRLLVDELQFPRAIGNPGRFASQVPRVSESGEQLAEAHRLLAPRILPGQISRITRASFEEAFPDLNQAIR